MNDFNALLAQVIPVLLLAAAFESRWLQRKPDRYGAGHDLQAATEDEPERRVHLDTIPFQPLVMLLMVLFVAGGEGLAVWAVFRGTSEPWMNAWVLLAGIASLLLVAWPLVQLHLNDLKDTFRGPGAHGITKAIHLALFFAIVFLGFVAVAIVAPFQTNAP